MIKGIDFAMLVTQNEDGHFHARPMSTQDVEFDGDLWFFTETNSPKVDDIRRNPHVNASYTRDQDFISISGTASIVTDVETKKKFWNEELRVWFQNGPEDPNVALIHVESHSAQYWDAPNGILGQAASMLAVLVTGNHEAGGENETVTFK